MALPKYGDLGSAALTSPSGQHYKTYGTADSSGNPGEYHIYYDGHVEFVASAPAPAPAADPAPVAPVIAAPAPAPAAAPAPAPSAPAPTSDSLADVHVYTVEHGHDSHGNPGDWHVYPGGNKVFVADSHKVFEAGGAVDMGAGVAASITAPAAPTVTSSEAQPTGGATPAADSAPTATVYTSEPGHDSHGNPGTWHDYPGGEKVFVADNPLAGTSVPSPAASAFPTPSVSATGPGPAVYPNPAITQAELLPTFGTAAPESSNTHTVVKGDTLSGIAAENHQTLAQIEALNPQISDPRVIHPGEKINLGGAESGPMSAAAGGFPTSSSYPPNPAAPVTAAPTPQSQGWAGQGTTPADPASTAVAVDTHHDTNPTGGKQVKGEKFEF